MKVRILGKNYTLTFSRRMSARWDGTCTDPHAPRRTIRIKKGLSEEDELETIIHEVLHAADWWKKEEWVLEVAHDIKNILWKLGYRKRKDVDRSS